METITTIKKRYTKVLVLMVIFLGSIQVNGQKYSYVYEFKDGLALVYNSRYDASKATMVKTYGCIDKSGREVIPVKYERSIDFYEGLAAVRLNGKWGYIDKSDNEVIPIKYDWVSDFSEGLARVELKEKVGFIDKNGREVIPIRI